MTFTPSVSTSWASAISLTRRRRPGLGCPVAMVSSSTVRASVNWRGLRYVGNAEQPYRAGQVPGRGTLWQMVNFGRHEVGPAEDSRQFGNQYGVVRQGGAEEVQEGLREGGLGTEGRPPDGLQVNHGSFRPVCRRRFR